MKVQKMRYIDNTARSSITKCYRCTLPAQKVDIGNLSAIIQYMNKVTKKSNKKELSGTHREFRHLGVMIEAVHDEVKTVAEQYGDIQHDIGGVKDQIGGIKHEIARVKDEIGGIKHEIGGIKQTLDIHTEMIGSTKEDIEIIKMDVEFIKGSMKKKVDVEEFSALERRVALLEKRR